MQVCPQCFSDIPNATESACPYCDAPTHVDSAVPAPAGPVSGPGAAVSEEALQFRRQFEERSIHLPAPVLRRAEAILSEADMELRRATVVLVDLCGFSRTGARVSAEDLSALAEAFYATCAQRILRRGGFVVKFIGDAVLAVFGAPMAYDRDTENAVYAALDIREAFANTHNPLLRDQHVSIGVATGAVRSGVMETPTGRAYDVLGDTVNLAARLQGAAGEDEIFLCQRTWQTVARAFDAEPTAPLALKNISSHYIAYRLVEEKAAATPRRAFDTPFTGRRQEMETLLGFLAAPTATGQVKVAHVRGEAGLGKSRLVHEALRRLGAEDRAAWWEASPSTASILLSPAMEWLRRRLDLKPGDDGGDADRAIDHLMEATLPEEKDSAVYLKYIFGVPQALERLHGMAADHIQANLFALLRMLLWSGAPKDNGSGQGPILVFDDLQWADPLTLRFVQYLVRCGTTGADDDAGLVDRRLSGDDGGGRRRPREESPSPPDDPRARRHEAPLTLVLTYRLDDEPAQPPGPGDLVMDLDTLLEHDRQVLLEQLVSDHNLLRSVSAIVLAKTSGNPLFIEEMTRLLNQCLRNDPPRDSDALKQYLLAAIPDSLRDLIQSRIDLLDHREKQILQCASLIGVEFAFSLIELFDLIREGLSEHLQTLCDLQYLEELASARRQDSHYYFTHGLFRDVSYASLLEEQKRKLHLTLARGLEQAFADRLHEYHELLAFHYSRGGETHRAIFHLTKAADRQYGLGGASHACQNYAEAIALLRSEAPSDSNLVLMTRLLCLAAFMRRNLGDAEEADALLESAFACARRLSAEHIGLLPRQGAAIALLHAGQYADAQQHIADILSIARRIGNRRSEVFALNLQGIACWHLGQFDEALDHFQETARQAQQMGAAPRQADALNNAGLILWRQGRYRPALDAFQQAMAIQRALYDRFGLQIAMANTGIIHEQLGEVTEARRAYEAALRLSAKIGQIDGLAANANNLSNLQRRLGDLDGALRHGRAALDHSRTGGAREREVESLENIALALEAQGDTAGARRHFEDALRLAEDLDLHVKRLGLGLYLALLAARDGKLTADDLTRIDGFIAEIDEKGYGDFRPRAWRARAMALDILCPERKDDISVSWHNALQSARDNAALFEERDTLRLMAQRCRRQGDAEEAIRLEHGLRELEHRLEQGATPHPPPKPDR